MSVPLAASKVSRASLLSRNLLLLNLAASIYNAAASYVVGLHHAVVSCHVIEGDVGIKVTSRQMQCSVNWSWATMT